MNINELKQAAAAEAIKYVEDGMILGLGTGSTVYYFLNKLSEVIKEGKVKNIFGIPTSKETESLATELGIPLTGLNENPKINLTVDGADEVDENLNAIKGGGGALLREKIIAQASERLVLIVDESKLSKNIGEKFFVPVEVIPMALVVENNYLKSIGAETKIRLDKTGNYYITDEGNYIIDAKFESIPDPVKTGALLNSRAGIVEHGMFLDIVNEVIAATKKGIQKFRS